MFKQPAYDLSRVSMLVVDHNKYMQILIKEILRAFNVRDIKTADDGADALKVLQTYPTDIIMTDWLQSPIDGLEFVQMIRRSPDSINPMVPIIMLSGHSEYHRVAQARDAGINEFLAKPVSPAALYHRISAIVRKPRVFIRCSTFVGPDRRRDCVGIRPYDGPERRKSSAPTVPNLVSGGPAMVEAQVAI